jgi:Tol biopolymer transport system component
MTRGTEAGMILGTAAYMSPEQARGRAVDKRADIWAFGVVLFEMLTGRSPFAGDSVAESIGLVVTREPDWSALPADTPATLKRLIARCLAKDPRQRLRDIGDASLELGQPMDAAPSAKAITSRRGVRPWVAGVAVLAGVALTAAATLWVTRQPPLARPRVARFDINAPGLQIDTYHRPVISPDGRRIAWPASGSLWVRDIDRVDPQVLVADVDPMHLTWSPDSGEVFYFAKNHLWRVRATGGEPLEIADFGTHRRGASTPGAAWMDDGRIVFSPAANGSALLVVDSRGGTLQTFFTPPPGILDFHSPSPLPNNRGILLVEDRDQKGTDTISVLAGGALHRIFQQDGERLESPVYSRNGYVLFERQVTSRGIWAVPFSIDTLSATGDPFPVLPNRSSPSVSSDGALLHTVGDTSFTARPAIVSRNGQVLRTIGPPVPGLRGPTLSPDGRRIAASYISDPGRSDIHVIDVATGGATRVTFGLGALRSRWVGDDRILFETGSAGAVTTSYIGVVAAEGGGVVKQLVTGAVDADISPDRRWLLYMRNTRERGSDIMGQALDPVTLAPMGAEQPIIATPANENSPLLHPSGRFLLYRGTEGVRTELYLTRFPEAQGKWQISTAGATFARWTPKGDAVVYAQTDHLIEVPITLEPAVSVGPARVVLDSNVSRPFVGTFDVAKDGQSLLMVQRVVAPDQPQGAVSLVLNWLEEFRAK